jgi:hypothetical protein
MRWRMKRTELENYLTDGKGGKAVYFYSFIDWSALGTDTVDLD